MICCFLSNYLFVLATYSFYQPLSNFDWLSNLVSNFLAILSPKLTSPIDRLSLRQKIELLIKKTSKIILSILLFLVLQRNLSTKIFIIKPFWKQRHCGVHFLQNIVDNKEKRRISKRMFQENKARQIFRKMNISYPWYVHVC